MPSDFRDCVLALKFLAASGLLLIVPMAVGGLGQAALSVAAVVLCLAIVAMTCVAATESADDLRFSVGRRRHRAGALCRIADPAAAGHVQPRAPGRSTERI